jgi:hypothetical protein
MNQCLRSLVVFACCAVVPAATSFAQHPAMPPGMTHQEHLRQMQNEAELKRRGAAAMGFDPDKTTHHFRLRQTGGAIEVQANDPADEASRAQIRVHLKDIAADFAAADFGKPLATHGAVPPGVDTMQRRRDALTFTYEDTTDGGRVRITTADANAKSAVHEFLRYQIREHATGDPLTVEK